MTAIRRALSRISLEAAAVPQPIAHRADTAGVASHALVSLKLSRGGVQGVWIMIT